MPITKPTYPGVSTAQLKEGFSKLKETMEQVQQRNGKVDMKALKREVDALDDPTVKAAYETIKDEYTTETRRRVSSGCGSSYRTTRTAPKQLKGDQVQSVFNALVQAKSKTTRLDKDKNAVIDAAEADKVPNLRGFSGQMVRAAINGNLTDYKAAMEDWDAHLSDVADLTYERQSAASDINELSDYHCKFKNGANAVKWALRDVATREDHQDVGHYDTISSLLTNAERGPQTKNPLLVYFGDDWDRDALLEEGHLDNKEVRDLLNVRDLEGFAGKMEAAVEKRLGMSYDDWVEGEDLVGREDLDDISSGGGCGSSSSVSSSSDGC